MCNVSDLVEILDILRSEKGCPWDREQTLESLRQYILEEALETIDRINQKDYRGLKEEVGDLLFEVLFVSKIASDMGLFHINDAVEEIKQKMIRRHPHVFGNETVNNSREVSHNWAKIKREKENKSYDSVLEDIPRGMPALFRAYKMTKRASTVNFDWERIEQVMEKLHEEIGEFEEALKLNDQEAIEHEIGDIIFAAVNMSRFVGLNPEIALDRANQRFEKRFKLMEEKLKIQGKSMEEQSLDFLESLWKESKME